MNNFTGDYAEFSPVHNANTVRDNNNSNLNNVHFTVDELLDFSGEDEAITDAFFGSLAGNSTDSSSVTGVDSCNSLISGGGDGQFDGDISCRSFTDSKFSTAELCVPYDDLAELEWLSNFVEESFSSDDIHHLNFIPTPTAKTTAVASTAAATTDNSSSSSVTTTISSTIQSPLPPPIFPSDVGVPGKARSKRSRAAPCNWSSRLLLLAATPNPSTNDISINSNTKAPKTTSFKRRVPTETRGRKCLHCASETTPQWRTGPMGPKTLCNACGVRYKSGRLVPEYRPAASPTFVPAKHSNSHRKVLELRRQNDMMGQVHIFNAANGCDDFLIHRQDVNGCDDFGHMI